MIRLLFAALLALSLMFGQNPNTAAFPTTVAVDQNLLAAKRLSESSLNGSINASTTTVVVSDGTQFLNWQIVRIDSEEMLIQSVSSNTLTIVSGGRGYNGTTAASHTTGAAVRGIITSWHHNQLAAEVKAIETRLRNVTGQCQDAGVNDTYACSPAPPFTAYATGMIVNFKANTANTSGATLNLNGIGNIDIKKVAGGVTTALDTNDIRAGQWVTVVYDGTNFQMISALGNAGSTGSGVSSCVPTSASGTTYTCTASPTVSSLTTGLVIAFKPDVGSSGSATLNVSGLGAIALYKTLPQSVVQIGNADLIADVEYLVIYNGTYWYILGVASAAYNYIMEEGSALTQRTVLNMIGVGVTCVDNSGSGRTECTIPADAVKAGSNTWSGANDFSGATSFIARFGTTAAASGDCDASGERGNVYVQTGDPASVATVVSVCTQIGASTWAWMPISHKVGTTAPATCAVGQVFFDSDATAGSNWLGCTSSNTWTLLGGAGGGSVSSVDATGGVETASGSAITSTGTVRGSFKRNAQTGTTYTVLTGDRGKTVTFSNAASIAVTLPQAGTGFEDGWFFVAKNIGAGTVTITPTTSTVDGAATITLLTGDFAIITSDGTNYETDNNKIISGSGVTITTARTGKQAAADTAVMLSHATAQAGPLRCAASDGDDAYDCNMTPSLTAYTDGMVVEFEATVTANTGAATLQIDSLAAGAKNIKLCDGTTDPATGDIAVGKQIPLRYDGTVFRLPCNPATVTGGGATGGSTNSIQYRVDGTTFGGAGPGSTGQTVISQGSGSAPILGYIKRYERYGVNSNTGQAAPGFFSATNVSLLGGANESNGIINLLTSSTVDAFLYFDAYLASNWVSTTSVTLELMRQGGSGSAVMEVTSACVATGESVISPSYNAVVSQTYNIGATTANTYQKLAFTPTMTNCAAGEFIHWRIARRGTDGADDFSDAVIVLGVIFENNYTVQ